ncbi:hypothetical protein NXY21_17625 [Bacteroides thetaiotaomicron]|nr:hypothetical protein [Bacteroides thetaiotaomicron]
MKYVIVSMFVLLVWVPKIVRAQVIVKTGYISSSSYKGENGRQTGGKGGSEICRRKREYSRVTETE